MPQAEGMSSVQALKQECAWHVGETTAFLQGKGKLVGRVVMGNWCSQCLLRLVLGLNEDINQLEQLKTLHGCGMLSFS